MRRAFRSTTGSSQFPATVVTPTISISSGEATARKIATASSTPGSQSRIIRCFAIARGCSCGLTLLRRAFQHERLPQIDMLRTEIQSHRPLIGTADAFLFRSQLDAVGPVVVE